MNITNPTKTKSRSNDDLIKHVESKYLRKDEKKEKATIEIGDIIRIGYSIPEGDKERIQYYEGLVIGANNRGLGKTFMIRRTVQGIGVEQIFVLNSPKILSITKKQSSKVRRSKLYFLRNLRGKSAKLKIKI
jgi:large subunit ribosomal protein L19